MKSSMQNYDIDLVYLWVDGEDPIWLAKKNAFLGRNANLNIESISKARNANHDELKFSLRSVEQNAPWIRRIFIVTDEQTPDWLDLDHPKVRIIDIRDILPSEALPCYNSVIIEYFLYKIPDLAEHFLYANDDMFVHTEVTPDFFFDAQGYPIVRLQRTMFGKWVNRFKKTFNIYTNIYRKTIDLSASLIEKKFGKYYSGTPHHNIDAYRKSDYQKVVEQVFSKAIMPTVTHHTRQDTDVQRIIFLYYALAVGRGRLRYVGRRESCRIRVQKPDFMAYIEKYNPILFCLNDTHRATDEDRKRIKPFLDMLFPEKSSFEK